MPRGLPDSGLPRDYFNIQIRFALAVVALDICDLATALTRYTNFHRRFGLGQPDRAALTSGWQEYLSEVNHDPVQLSEWTW